MLNKFTQIKPILVLFASCLLLMVSSAEASSLINSTALETAYSPLDSSSYEATLQSKTLGTISVPRHGQRKGRLEPRGGA